MFATMVESCAFGQADLHTSLTIMMPVQPSAETTQIPSINPGSFNTCAWIERDVILQNPQLFR